MIPNDVIGRILLLRIGNSTATGFLIDVKGCQYLVTARHFAREIDNKSELRVFFEEKWNDLGSNIIGHAPGEIDISVFALNGVTANPILKLNPNQAILYGQDVYFIGYPYGWWGDSGKVSVGRPLPFVRKAIVSCIEDSQDGAHRNFLAGHNVPGFSGVPVVFPACAPTEVPPTNFQVTSVVSGYRFVDSPIFVSGEETNARVKENTEVIITYGIRHALDIIDKNPIGPKLGKPKNI